MFIEIPASKSSLANRRLVFGVGNNNSEYMVRQKLDKKQATCPYYQRWFSMLERCYSVELHKKRPTYKDCTICEEWLTFSNFRDWMIKQDWEEKQLDKDILTQGNKIYSPETCIFVTREINTLLVNQKSTRGLYPQGVYWNVKDKKFRAALSVNGKVKQVGSYLSCKAAHQAYKKFKYAVIKEVAEKQAEPLRSALLAYTIN